MVMIVVVVVVMAGVVVVVAGQLLGSSLLGRGVQVLNLGLAEDAVTGVSLLCSLYLKGPTTIVVTTKEG